MLRILAILASLACGAGLGLAVTRLSLKGEPPLGRLSSGAWTAWPDAGTSAADPYERAVAAQNGRLPLPAAAGLRFLAKADDAGARLTGDCDYRVSGAMPAAQYWSLATLGPSGVARPSPDLPLSLTSWAVTRGDDGTATLTLSRQARPGNWLAVRDSGSFVLMLSLYDTPVGATLAAGAPGLALPRITRLRCAS